MVIVTDARKLKPLRTGATLKLAAEALDDVIGREYGSVKDAMDDAKAVDSRSDEMPDGYVIHMDIVTGGVKVADIDRIVRKEPPAES